MRLITATLLTLVLITLYVFPAYAASSTADVSGRVDIRLADYDIVIGDMGDRYDTWSDSPTRISAEVMDGGRTQSHYFDSLPAAFYVLRQMYGDSRMVQMEIPDYVGQKLIDGTKAYYVWDNDHQGRGGTPLVLAFSSNRAALAESRNRHSEVLDFDGVVKSLASWADNNRDHIYWRGSNKDQWDNARWNSAWDTRWQGWGWHNKRGWSKTDPKLDSADPDRNKVKQGKSKRVRQDKVKHVRNRHKQDNGDSARGDEGKKDKGEKDQGNGKGKGKGHSK